MSFKKLLKLINEDLILHAGKSFVRKTLVIFFNMSFRLVLNYRLGCFLAKRRNVFVNILILVLKKKQIRNLNCDISYHASIGRRIKFPHPLSIVIGDNAIVGNDVMIWQEVTLGSHGKKGSIIEYPTIGNNVKLFSGCKIIGNVNIGQNSSVAANAVVLKHVPNDSVAIGIPSKNKIIK